MMRGRFLSLEGGEGAGKSTQVRRLAEALSARGVACVVTREPGGSEGAEAIRNLLMQGSVARWSARTEALLFAAARADHVERTIRPALAEGRWVLCDRYIDSTRAYQGAAGGITDDEIMALHRFGSAALLPDRTFVLAVDVEEGATRAAWRDCAVVDRFAKRGTEFHMAVARAFERIAAAEPDRVRVIDGARAPDLVTQSILDQLEALLP